MTDIEKFIELYKSIGIELTPKKDPYNDSIIRLELEADGTEKVNGYYGFVTYIEFNLDGSFKEQSIWE